MGAALQLASILLTSAKNGIILNNGGNDTMSIMDIRPAEEAYAEKIAKMLSELYPTLVRYVPYKHPMLGDRFAIMLDGKQVDVANIVSFTADLYNNRIIINTSFGQIEFDGIVEDDTLIDTSLGDVD